LELEPAELGFKRPYDKEVSQVLRLRNSSQNAIAFKVKTTAPKQYCVRPNSGKIEPGQAVEVSVVLQPMREDPPLDAKCRDKFLVQSIPVAASKDVPAWNQLEKEHKASIQERKIRVHYLPADGQTPRSNGVDSHADDSVLSPPPQYTPMAGTTREPSSHENTVASEKPRSETAESPRQLGEADSNIQFSREDLLERLHEANATIARLKKQEESGLRRRKDGGSYAKETERATAGLATRTESGEIGVPVRIVFLLCIAVFLMTWLLF